MSRPVRRLLIAWGALVLLLAGEIVLALLPLEHAKLPLILALTVLMVAIVMIVFMELRSSSALVRIFAAAGIFWLGLLLGLSGNDYATRTYVPAGPFLPPDRPAVVP